MALASVVVVAAPLPPAATAQAAPDPPKRVISVVLEEGPGWGEHTFGGFLSARNGPTGLGEPARIRDTWTAQKNALVKGLTGGSLPLDGSVGVQVVVPNGQRRHHSPITTPGCLIENTGNTSNIDMFTNGACSGSGFLEVLPPKLAYQRLRSAQDLASLVDAVTALQKPATWDLADCAGYYRTGPVCLYQREEVDRLLGPALDAAQRHLAQAEPALAASTRAELCVAGHARDFLDLGTRFSYADPTNAIRSSLLPITQPPDPVPLAEALGAWRRDGSGGGVAPLRELRVLGLERAAWRDLDAVTGPGGVSVSPVANPAVAGWQLDPIYANASWREDRGRTAQRWAPLLAPFPDRRSGVAMTTDVTDYAERFGSVCFAPEVDLVGLEAIQVVQDLHNSVPLVEHKEVAVRAHLQPAEGQARLDLGGIRLDLRRDGTSILPKPLRPVKPVVAVSKAREQRWDPDVAATFRLREADLPPGALTGSLELVLLGPLSGDRYFRCREDPGRAAGTDCRLKAQFQKMDPVTIHMVRSNLTTGGNRYATTDQTVADHIDQLLASVPSAEIDVESSATEITLRGAPTAQNRAISHVIDAALRAQALQIAYRAFRPGSSNEPFLVVVPDAPCPPAALGCDLQALSLGNTPAKKFEPPTRGFPLAMSLKDDAVEAALVHEWGHLMGRDHPRDPGGTVIPQTDSCSQGPTPGPSGRDEYDFHIFPDLKGPLNGVRLAALGPMSAPNAPDRMAGWDSRGFAGSGPRLISPEKALDSMGYCGFATARWLQGQGLAYQDEVTAKFTQTLWPSAKTYTEVSSSMRSDWASATDPPTPVPGGFAQVIEIRGSDPSRGPTTIDATLGLTTATMPVLPGSGPYFLRIKDSSGIVLQDIPFDPSSAAPLGGDGADISAAAVPAPSLADAARYEVVRDGTVIGSRQVSASAPTVELVSPQPDGTETGDEVTIRWNAADADGDPLTANVQFQPAPGEPWDVIAAGVTGNEVSIPRARLGGLDRAKVQVVVTDGLRMAVDELDGTFSVPAADTAVAIAAPTAGATFSRGALIDLRAEVTSTGTHGDQADDLTYTWTSDRAGELATGAERSIDAIDLQPGTHHLTVTARRADGAAFTSDPVTITVQDLPDQPVPLRPSASLSQLQPTAPGTVAVAVVNSGTGPAAPGDLWATVDSSVEGAVTGVSGADWDCAPLTTRWRCHRTGSGLGVTTATKLTIAVDGSDGFPTVKVTATASGDPDDVEDTIEVSSVPLAHDMSGAVTAPATAEADGDIEYSVTAAHSSGSPEGTARLTHRPPASLQLLRAEAPEPWTCTATTVLVDCSAPYENLSPGDQLPLVRLTARARPDAPATVPLAATGRDDDDSEPGNDLATASIRLNGARGAPGDFSPDVAAVSTVPTALVPGLSATVPVTVTNVGQGATFDVITLTGTLTGVAVTSITSDDGTFACGSPTDLSTCRRTEPLAPGATTTLSVRIEAPATVGSTSSFGVAATTAGDGNAANRGTTTSFSTARGTSTTVRPSIDIGTGPVRLGDTVTGRVVARNPRTSALTGPTTLVIGGSGPIASASGQGWACTIAAGGSSATCTRPGAVAAGETLPEVGFAFLAGYYDDGLTRASVSSGTETDRATRLLAGSAIAGTMLVASRAYLSASPNQLGSGGGALEPPAVSVPYGSTPGTSLQYLDLASGTSAVAPVGRGGGDRDVQMVDVASSGQRVAWGTRTRLTGSGATHLWVADPDGTGAVTVAGGPDPSAYVVDAVTLAPDGRDLIYEHQGQLYRVDLRGTAPSAPTLLAAGSQPDIGPDGATLVFSRAVGTRHDLFTRDLSTGTEVNLTQTTSVDERFPEWSPDGRTLLYAIGSQLVTWQPGQSLPGRVLATGVTNAGQAAWAPDGERVAHQTVNRLVLTRADGDGSLTATSIAGSPPFAWMPAGEGPTARDDEAAAVPGAPTEVDVLANDAAGSRIVDWTRPEAGAGAVSCTTSSCTYRAPWWFAGGDEFHYAVTGPTGHITWATVRVVAGTPPGRLRITQPVDGSTPAGPPTAVAGTFDAPSAGSPLGHVAFVLGDTNDTTAGDLVGTANQAADCDLDGTSGGPGDDITGNGQRGRILDCLAEATARGIEALAASQPSTLVSVVAADGVDADGSGVIEPDEGTAAAVDLDPAEGLQSFVRADQDADGDDIPDAAQAARRFSRHSAFALPAPSGDTAPDAAFRVANTALLAGASTGPRRMVHLSTFDAGVDEARRGASYPLDTARARSTQIDTITYRLDGCGATGIARDISRFTAGVCWPAASGAELVQRFSRMRPPPVAGAVQVSLNGSTPVPAAIGADGSWSASMPGDLLPGPNQVTATLTADAKGYADSVIVHGRANQPPATGADGAEGDVGSDIAVDVLVNDSDPDGDPLRVVAASQPADGTVTCAVGGRCTLAGTTAAGDHVFTYTVQDARGDEATGTVTVAVRQPNRAPSGPPVQVTTPAGQPVVVDVLAGATDADGDAVTAADPSQPFSGSVTCTSSTCAYTPDPGTSGTDAFTVVLRDGRGGESTRDVTVEVDRPEADLGLSISGDTAWQVEKSARVVIDLSGAGLLTDPAEARVTVRPPDDLGVEPLGLQPLDPGTTPWQCQPHGDVIDCSIDPAAPATGGSPSRLDLAFRPARAVTALDLEATVLSPRDPEPSNDRAKLGVTILPAPADPGIGLSPAASTQRVGRDAVLLATVAAGAPVAGAEVTLEVVDGPNTGTTATGTTAADGTVGLTYRGAGGPGTDTVTARATIDGASVTSPEATVTWEANRSPSAVLSDAFAVDEGGSVTLDASGSTDPDGDRLTFAWSPAAGLDDPSSATPVATAADDGATRYTVTVRDPDGAEGSATATLTTRNVAPDLTATAPATIVAGEPWSVVGSFTDPGADTWTATLDPGDGTPERTAAVDAAARTVGADHVFDRPGQWHAVLVVCDDDAGCSTVELEVTVEPPTTAVPVADPQSVATDEDVPLPLRLTATSPAGGALAFSVDERPAHGHLEGAGPDLVYVPDADFSGTDRFTFTASTAEQVSEPAEVAISIRPVNDAPTATIDGPTSVSEGSTVLLDATASSDRDGTIEGYAWDTDGDGSLDDGTGTTASPAFADDGPASVRLSVTDDGGLEGTTTRALAVTNVAPAIAAVSDATVPAGSPITRTVAFSDPGADSWTATVDRGDGTGPVAVDVDGATKTVALSHSYATVGDRTVTVAVCDDDGGCDRRSFTVRVTGAGTTADEFGVVIEGRRPYRRTGTFVQGGVSIRRDAMGARSIAGRGTIDGPQGRATVAISVQRVARNRYAGFIVVIDAKGAVLSISPTSVTLSADGRTASGSMRWWGDRLRWYVVDRG